MFVQTLSIVPFALRQQREGAATETMEALWPTKPNILLKSANPWAKVLFSPRHAMLNL